MLKGKKRTDLLLCPQGQRRRVLYPVVSSASRVYDIPTCCLLSVSQDAAYLPSQNCYFLDDVFTFPE